MNTIVKYSAEKAANLGNMMRGLVDSGGAALGNMLKGTTAGTKQLPMGQVVGEYVNPMLKRYKVPEVSYQNVRPDVLADLSEGAPTQLRGFVDALREGPGAHYVPGNVAQTLVSEYPQLGKAMPMFARPGKGGVMTMPGQLNPFVGLHEGGRAVMRQQGYKPGTFGVEVDQALHPMLERFIKQQQNKRKLSPGWEAASRAGLQAEDFAPTALALNELRRKHGLMGAARYLPEAAAHQLSYAATEGPLNMYLKSLIDRKFGAQG